MSRKLWIPSPFRHPRGNYPLDMIVVHHIGSKNGKLYGVGGTITWFTDEEVHRNPKTGKIENKVSAHYIIPREPYKEYDIIECAKPVDIAYHAGYSSWTVNGKQRKYINNYSVGIELAGDGNLVEYTDYQYEHLIELSRNLVQNYNIPTDNIVGHEDISPGRKVDPGETFDWKRYRTGINPPKVFTMPEATIKADKTEEEEIFMESGENTAGKRTTVVDLLMKFLRKILSQ